MSEDKNSIWIGYDPREATAWEIARRSMIRHLSQPIPIHKLVLGDLQARGLYTRPTERLEGRLIDVLSIRDDYDGSIATEHANARFLVPHLAQSGWALFMDGDVLVRADVAKLLASLDPQYAVCCVKHAYMVTRNVKMDDQVQTSYARKNWSSVVAFNCDHPANKMLTLPVVNSWPGRDLHAFRWLDTEDIGALDPEWNWLAGISDPKIDPKIVHFTDGIPDMPGYENAPYADEWRAELERRAA